MKRVLILSILFTTVAACSGGQIGEGDAGSTPGEQHHPGGGFGDGGGGGFGGTSTGGTTTGGTTTPPSSPNMTAPPANPNATPTNPNATAGPVGNQTLHVVNNCSYTVWLGTLTGGGSISNPPTQPALAQGQAVDLSVSANWSGRVWARTGCTFNGTTGTCATGDCGGQLSCTGAGKTPATLAEFTLGGAGGQTFYDVSLVDGFNVPTGIQPGTPNAACGSPACAANVNASCPSQLQVTDTTGQVIACQSACDALQTPQACCTGAFSSSATCSPTSFAQGFKAQCPSAYSYAFDDATSTFTCPQTAFVVTFCP